MLPNGPECVTLITTRNLNLAEALGGQELPVSVLTPWESYELLKEVTGSQRVAAEQGCAYDIGRILGHLPLADQSRP